MPFFPLSKIKAHLFSPATRPGKQHFNVAGFQAREGRERGGKRGEKEREREREREMQDKQETGNEVVTSLIFMC